MELTECVVEWAQDMVHPPGPITKEPSGKAALGAEVYLGKEQFLREGAC